MKCLVINLDRSADRLKHMQRMFDAAGQVFERFPAIDGSQIAESTMERINARNRWVRPLVRAEIGCLLSHRACWEIIAAGPDSFGVIFEDDMLVTSGIGPALNTARWPAGTDFIKLETRNRAVVVSSRFIPAAPGYELARLFSFHDGLGGYALSQRCARWLHDCTSDLVAPVDQLVLNPQFGIFAQLKAYQLMPAVCIPSSLAPAHVRTLASTIDPDGALYRGDDELLRPIDGTPRGILRTFARAVGSLQRALQGRQRVRVPFR